MNKNFADFGKSVLLGMEEFVPKVDLLEIYSPYEETYGPSIYAPFEFQPLKAGGGDGAYSKFMGFLEMKGASAGFDKTPREILGEHPGITLYVRGGSVSIMVQQWRNDYSLGIQIIPVGNYEVKYCTMKCIYSVDGVLRWKNPAFE